MVAFFAATFVLQPDWIARHGDFPVWARWAMGVIFLCMLVVEFFIIFDEEELEGSPSGSAESELAWWLARKTHN